MDRNLLDYQSFQLPICSLTKIGRRVSIFTLGYSPGECQRERENGGERKWSHRVVWWGRERERETKVSSKQPLHTLHLNLNNGGEGN